MLMEKKIVATLSTISENVFPHITQLWLVEHNDKLYFSCY